MGWSMDWVHGVVHGPGPWGGPWTPVHVLYTSDNFVHEVIPEEWLENFRMSSRSLLNLSELLRPGAEVAFQCGQRNSLKTINVDGEHFIRFRSKSCVFKFIRLIKYKWFYC